jgi:O-antigen ligase
MIRLPRNSKVIFIISLVVLLIAVFIGLVMSKLEAPLGQALVLAVLLGSVVLPIVIKDPYKGIAIMGFCLPFERIPTVEIAGASIKINHVLLFVVALGYILSKLKDNPKVVSDPLRWPIFAFFVSLFISLPVAINLSRSIEVLFFMTLMVAIYLLVVQIVSDKKALIAVIKGIIWGGVFVGFFAVYQFLGDMVGLPTSLTLLKPGYDKSTFGFARVQSFSQEPLYFANYIFIPLFISLVLMIRGQIQTIINKNLSYVLCAVLLIDFVIALSRGAYIGAVIAFIVLAIIQARNIFTLKTTFAIITAVFFVGLGSYLALVRSNPDSLDKFIEHVAVQDRYEGESVVSRLSASSQAIDIWESRKAFGSGIGNFGPIVQGADTTPDGGWFIVNNEYLEILAENGAVGLFFFIVMIVAFFVRGTIAFIAAKDKLLKSLMLGLMIALLAILVQYATFSTLYIIHFWFLLGLIGATSNIIFTQNAKESS